jgi:hypothetical protein
MREKKSAKYDDNQIKNGALESDGKRVAAQLKKMRDYETTAYEKAGHELRKMDEFWTSLSQTLAEVKAKCKGDGFKTFQEKYCPDLQRSRIYELLRIGRGAMTLEEARDAAAKRKREQRVRDSANVTDKPPKPNLFVSDGQPGPVGPKKTLLPDGTIMTSPPTVPAADSTAGARAEQKQIDGVIAGLPRSWDVETPTEADTKDDTEASAEARKAQYAETEAVPTSSTTEAMIQNAAANSENEWNELKQILDARLPKLLTVDKVRLFAYIINHPALAKVKPPRREKARAA